MTSVSFGSRNRNRDAIDKSKDTRRTAVGDREVMNAPGQVDRDLNGQGLQLPERTGDHEAWLAGATMVRLATNRIDDTLATSCASIPDRECPMADSRSTPAGPKLFARRLAETARAGVAALRDDLRPAQPPKWESRIAGATAVPSVCPYCAVGCDTMVYVKNGEIIDIEGDRNSPINQGTLCPKGAAIYQLHINPNRMTKVLYRRPYGTAWETLGLDEAMDMVAARVKKTRDETFQETYATVTPDGEASEKTFMASLGIFSLGGATMDNEWNHLQQKLMRGLGVVAIENQARI